MWQRKLERKKAVYVEKMQNKIADIHKKADEKRAMVEDVKGEERAKVEEKAGKFREIGHVPKKILCFNFWNLCVFFCFSVLCASLDSF